MSFSKHPTALVEEGVFGDGSSIGPYSIVGAGVRMGQNCAVGAHNVLSGPLEIAHDVTIEAHCYLRGPLTIGRGVVIGSQACLDAQSDQAIQVKDHARIGAHVLVAPGVSINERAVIEAGSVVVRDVPPNAIVAGNPAKIIRYAATSSAPILFRDTGTPVIETTMPGVTLHHLPLVEDLRGNLSFGEAGRHVPFPVKRYFLTFDVASEEARGEHAHRHLHQFLICVHGRLHLLADDGYRREEFILDRPNVALYLPPLVWGVQYRFSADAVLLVLCSDYYQPEDYIRDYAEFLAVVRGPGPNNESQLNKSNES